MSEIILFSNTNIVREDAIQNGSLYVQNGKIVAPVDSPDRILDLDGKLVVPGLIDLQINGGFGVDFTAQPDKASTVQKNLPCFGVTSFLITLVSQPLENYEKILKTCDFSSSIGAQPLGFHLEGPHFNKKRKGAHSEEHILERCDLSFWKEIIKRYPVKMVTLAPELEGALELIQFLSKEGIKVSCGHTEADTEVLRKAKIKGLSFATHLFNAMRPLSAREPGVIGFVLGDRALDYSLIADTVHVSPESVRVCYNANPDGLMLVSDASSLMGMESGEYYLGKEKIVLKNKRAHILGTETLAGSVCPLNEMVVNFQKMTSCSLVEAINAATIKPAKLLGLQGKKGSLQIGADADFFISKDEKLQPLATYVGGALVYEG